MCLVNYLTHEQNNVNLIGKVKSTLHVRKDILNSLIIFKLTTNKLNPIGFANGDGGTGRGATMARELIFGKFPTVDVPVTVEARLDTNDKCIEDAVKAFIQCGAGFKNSTASNDPRIREKKWKSANIVMRPMLGAYAMLRLLQGPGFYPKPCGTLRYAHGGFYDEQSCVEEMIDGVRTAVITQHLNLDDLPLFAKLAIDTFHAHNLHLILSSKKTIANSELLFYSEVSSTLKAGGLQEGVEKDDAGNMWTGDFHHELTDMALAHLPIKSAIGSKCAEGGFLHLADNPTGDSSSDIIDFQHGNNVMSSTVHCADKNRNLFTYEELPGGTADGKTTGPLKGAKFLSPVGIIFGMASAFEKVNPGEKYFFDEVRRLTLDYVLKTPKEERDTEVMLHQIAEKTENLIGVQVST